MCVWEGMCVCVCVCVWAIYEFNSLKLLQCFPSSYTWKPTPLLPPLSPQSQLTAFTCSKSLMYAFAIRSMTLLVCVGWQLWGHLNTIKRHWESISGVNIACICVYVVLQCFFFAMLQQSWTEMSWILCAWGQGSNKKGLGLSGLFPLWPDELWQLSFTFISAKLWTLPKVGRVRDVDVGSTAKEVANPLSWGRLGVVVGDGAWYLDRGLARRWGRLERNQRLDATKFFVV